jgi:hypothetical protein
MANGTARVDDVQFDDYDGSEAVVEFGDVDIFRPHARHRVGAFACPILPHKMKRPARDCAGGPPDGLSD